MVYVVDRVEVAAFLTAPSRINRRRGWWRGRGGFFRGRSPITGTITSPGSITGTGTRLAAAAAPTTFTLVAVIVVVVALSFVAVIIPATSFAAVSFA